MIGGQQTVGGEGMVVVGGKEAMEGREVSAGFIYSRYVTNL